MCFSLPLKVVKKDRDELMMEDGRKVKRALTEEVKIGDYLMCHQDVAVEKLSKKDALRMRQTIKGVADELAKGD